MSNSQHLATVMVDTFIEAVEKGIDLVPVVADSTSTAKINPFMVKFPDRVINVGIAEQALVGTAAGLALAGKVAVTCNAAPFLISRANEQVKVDICYNDTNVKLFGLNSGASYGPLASTHHSIDDISIMRGFGNIQIFAPSTPLQCKKIIEYALTMQGPVYVRMDGKPLPELHNDDYQFVPGAIDLMHDGQEIALVAMGSTLHEVMEARAELYQQGYHPKVIGIPSIRPLDRYALQAALENVSCVITAEEHNVNGGLGAIIAEVIAEGGLHTKLIRLGVQDGHYAMAGDRASTRQALHIDAKGIVNTVLNAFR